MEPYLPNAPECMMEDFRADTAYIHDSASIDPPCHIGEQSAVMHFSHIMGNTVIGSHTYVGERVSIGSGVIIGHNVKVMNNAQLHSGVILEDDVYFGPSSVVLPLPRMKKSRRSISRITPTLVKTGTTIGPNASIAAGLIIGAYAFIEAGAVLDRNIPDFALVYGNPMKFGGWLCACGDRLKFSDTRATCTQCGNTYTRLAERKIVPGEENIRHVVKRQTLQ